MILWATIGSGLILVGYYYYYFNVLNHPITPGIKPNTHPVTLLICVKNGIEEVRQNLSSWCDQDYPDYEVVIIDDHSTDCLCGYLQKIQNSYPHLSCYKAPVVIKDSPGKKAALLYGLKQARSPWILMTDADCRPASRFWIREMMGARTRPATQCIIGYSPLERTSALQSRWLAFETSWVALQYLGFARKGEAYMGVGRNLLILRDVALAADLHPELASGDDDFLVQSVDPKRVEICVHPDSWVFTSAPEHFIAWITRKTRHSQTSMKYPSKIKTKLIIFHGAMALFYAGLLSLIIINSVWLIALIWITYSGILFPVRRNLSNNLGIPRNVWIWTEPLVLMSYCVILFRMFFQSKQRWA
ncbi:MAG: glycosyltransferase [Saprospiraceae bacterium]